MSPKLFNHGAKPKTQEQLLELLTQWFASESGKRLLERQRLCVTNTLTRCFGYHLLQLAADTQFNLFDDCRVQKKYRVHPFVNSGDVKCHFDELPFANESLDVVIVHHVHEFLGSPHQLLREMQRVVVPHGHLIIVGFNPWSTLGMYSRLAKMMPASMWQNQLISSRKMKDWLSLLGFETQYVEYGCHNPQYLDDNASPWLKQKLQRWPLGRYYVMSAIKQVATMTPVKLHWAKPRKQFAGLAPVEPKVAQLIHDRHIKEDVA